MCVFLNAHLLVKYPEGAFAGVFIDQQPARVRRHAEKCGYVS
jgi:hypothetical protein